MKNKNLIEIKNKEKIIKLKHVFYFQLIEIKWQPKKISIFFIQKFSLFKTLFEDVLTEKLIISGNKKLKQYFTKYFKVYLQVQ